MAIPAMQGCEVELFNQFDNKPAFCILGNYWLSASLPENRILINAATAAAHGFKDGDRARVASATNSDGVWDLRTGEKIPLQGMRPGVVAISWHFDHWAYGANDVEIDGQHIPGEKSRRAGLCQCRHGH